MSADGAAVVAFTTGLIAGTLARPDGALRCDVFTPEFDGERCESVLPITTANGIRLEIVVREAAERGQR